MADLEKYQIRVIEERNALDLKREALMNFIDVDPKFHDLPAMEKSRLRRQLSVMNEYSVVLGQRIADF